MKFIKVTTMDDSELFLLDSESYKEGYSFSQIAFIFTFTFDKAWMNRLATGY